MLTSDDIKAIVQAGKEIYSTKEDLAALDIKFGEKLNSIANTLDAMAKSMKDYHQEATVNRTRVERMEEWIQKAAQKIGLEYKA